MSCSISVIDMVFRRYGLWTRYVIWGLMLLSIIVLYKDKLAIKVCCYLLELALILVTEVVILSPYAELIAIDSTHKYQNIDSIIPARSYMTSLCTIIISSLSVVVPVLWHRLEKRLSTRLITILIAVMLFQLAIAHTIYLGSEQYFTKNIAVFLLSQVIISLLINFYAYTTIRQAIQTRQISTELAYYKSRQQLEYDYYALAAQNAQETRKLHHDMSNQLQTAMAVSGTMDYEHNRAEKIYEQLQDRLDDIVRVEYCDNAIVNAIITTQVAAAKEKAINFTVEANMSDNLPFEEIDLCSLFLNLCINAIEACDNVMDMPRIIEIQTNILQGNLVIRFRNPYIGAIRHNLYGEIITSKADKKNHGNGLKIVRSVVKKYDGSILIEDENQMFTVTITLPLR
jgi:sensor histidine kinase YesM